MFTILARDTKCTFQLRNPHINITILNSLNVKLVLWGFMAIKNANTFKGKIKGA